ncbi:camk protein kinase [Diplodia corticola]|uniref:Camk protein kinase n=1 Tax=Diplodia corticola TaxID=236234 RepID=A0A1J9RBD3_9PEZI|nr:camk protein kinase [Diplodia corticola]OJD38918.1 camk protein kinase [Diplodia corticola]
MVESSAPPRKGQVGPLVAFLDVRDAAYEYDGRDSELSSRIPIHANQEFHLGRHSPELDYAHQTISKRHLKFHCILFDNDGQWGIQPLVYAEDTSTNGTHLKRAQAYDTVMMRPHLPTTLLEDNDELWFAPLKFLRGKLHVISRRYQVKPRVIGEGGYGAVHVAIHRKTQRQLACKVVNLDLLHQQGRCVERLTREFEVLQNLNHPNIIKLEKVYHSDAGLYIFQELVSGGDLFSFITNRHASGMPTIEAAVIAYQILKGVEYLHDSGIVHRDIKPDNILLTSTKTASRVVITDFGQARNLPDEDSAQRMKSVAGTLGFNAPEIFRRNPKVLSGSGYSKAVDIWSVGCVSAQLLTGKPIFHDKDAENQEAAVKQLSSRCNLDILDNDPAWQKVGRRAKDFIRRTVVLDENDRLSAKEALRHDWFSNRAHVDEFEAVYQHVTKDWEPRRRIFKIIEHIPSARPQMQLNTSQFFPPIPLPVRRPLPMVDLLSGQSPVMPVIDEEAACPDASSTRPSSTGLGEDSEIPGPPQTWGGTASEEWAPAKCNEATQLSRPPLAATGQSLAGRVLQQDSNTRQSLDQDNQEQQQVIPTQLLTQNNYSKKQDIQIHYHANSAKQNLPLRSSVPDSSHSNEADIREEMRQLSLAGQKEEEGMDIQGARQPSWDFDQEMTQDSLSKQQNGATFSRKEQASSDFDHNNNDTDFWEIALTSEFKQPAAKRLRTG